jgi:hypothetical protein
MTKNFEAYFNLDKTGLQNKYVIIINGKVAAKGEDIENMLDKVKKNILVRHLLSLRFPMKG